MRNKSLFSAFIFIIIAGVGLLWTRYAYDPRNILQSGVIAIVSVVTALIVSSAIRVSDPWDKAVVLRLGHFRSHKGPGLFFIIPVIDTIPYWIDTRVITTSFKAEKTPTKDTVPVDVDAVLFWKVLDP
jgi:regulator of protease activity HflC (stomatin/prohibitin superfamily)